MHCNPVSCDLPLLGGRGVKYFSNWTQESKTQTMKRFSVFILIIISLLPVFGQENPSGTNYGKWENNKHAWAGWWISHPNASGTEYGVFHFRKEFQLSEIPEQFVVHVSADNRYQLYVNGVEVCKGPARSDFVNWQYETIDIADHLVAGENTIAALVYNFGSFRPASQLSRQTGFILQGESENQMMVNTNNTWKVKQSQAYHPVRIGKDNVHGFYVAGPGDSLVATNHLWGWELPGFDDADWLFTSGNIGNRGNGKGHMHGSSRSLTKRTIPLMDEQSGRFTNIARTEPSFDVSNEFLQGSAPLVIPSNTHVKILIDNTTLEVGFPLLTFSGGKDAVIRIKYAEALYDENRKKGNRNEIEGKTLTGVYDVIVADGGEMRKFSPLWLRTFRYVQIEVKTGNAPLTLNDFNYTTFKYPFNENASVDFFPQTLSFDRIWETGWRTARLCANEIYWDCPYYEQLQYIGDTRIQMLISLYVSGDDRLMRNAIRYFNSSMSGEGLTMSNAPISHQTFIPTFSLAYIGVLHDYLMHKPDTAFLVPLLPNINVILSWFDRRMQANGLLGPVDWWPFTDWADGFPNGIPSGSEEGSSTVLTLTYAKALVDAAYIFTAFGQKANADASWAKYEEIKKGVNEVCFDASKGLYADTPEMKTYSQHANILAILSNVADDKDQAKLMTRVLEDKSLIQCTLYYKFYLMRALEKAGLGNRYFEQLTVWEDMLKLGLTTFPENESRSNWIDDVRSDCHAWSASVCYDFLSVICGINPSSTGFRTVRISPNPGPLSSVKGRMPHPGGAIAVDLEFDNNKASGTVELPVDVTGVFVWNGREIPLKGGLQTIDLKH
jgi:alpha-L-rhamnosidase